MVESKPSKARIKILHVTFNMGIGGTEQVIRQLVQSLDTTRFENEIACIDGDVGALGQELKKSGVILHSLGRTQGIDRDLIRSLRSLIIERSIDIVHCHQYTPYFYGWAAHWGTDAKVVFTEHGRFHPDRKRVKAFWLNPLMALTTASIVSISKATRAALQTYEFIPAFKTKVIYNGIRPPETHQAGVDTIKEQYNIQPEELTIGTVARLDVVKNQPLMVKALKVLLEKDIPVRLLLVGDGPERSALEKMVSDMGLTEKVIFTGFINEPANYLASMDVFLLTSYTEGTSMTLLEAMSLEIPSVVTAVGGNVEIIEDKITGLLIPSDDADALVSAIEQLYRQPELRKSLAQSARLAFEQRFSSQEMVRCYQAEYERSIGMLS